MIEYKVKEGRESVLFSHSIFLLIPFTFTRLNRSDDKFISKIILKYLFWEVTQLTCSSRGPSMFLRCFLHF